MQFIIIYKIAWLAFTAFLVGISKDYNFLLFLCALPFIRHKQAKKSITEHMESLHDRLDVLEKQTSQTKD